MAGFLQSPEAAEYTRQIKEKLKEAEYLGTESDDNTFWFFEVPRSFFTTTGACFVSLLDLEGRTDDKIRIMEQVEELRLKRADRQVHFPFLLSPC